MTTIVGNANKIKARRASKGVCSVQKTGENQMQFLSIPLALILLCTVALSQGQEGAEPSHLFAKQNLVAWCIVPFDSAKRNPEQRAEMLSQLGMKRLAYDYRAEHIPTFQREIDALKKWDIELLAWWFPMTLNDEAKGILQILKSNDLHPQLWVMGGGDKNMKAEEERAFLDAEVAKIESIAMAANEMGCKVGLYNHGGWFGQPENQVKILNRLKSKNVGVVLNMHHAHDRLDHLTEDLQMLKPYLIAININGMQTDGERLGKKILPIGEGDCDLAMLRTILSSQYEGPIGILNHTDEDARVRLEQNMSGLERLVPLLTEK
jgi:hypothetical protein